MSDAKNATEPLQNVVFLISEKVAREVPFRVYQSSWKKLRARGFIRDSVPFDEAVSHQLVFTALRSNPQPDQCGGMKDERKSREEE